MDKAQRVDELHAELGHGRAGKGASLALPQLLQRAVESLDREKAPAESLLIGKRDRRDGRVLAAEKSSVQRGLPMEELPCRGCLLAALFADGRDWGELGWCLGDGGGGSWVNYGCGLTNFFFLFFFLFTYLERKGLAVARPPRSSGSSARSAGCRVLAAMRGQPDLAKRALAQDAVELPAAQAETIAEFGLVTALVLGLLPLLLPARAFRRHLFRSEGLRAARQDWLFLLICAGTRVGEEACRAWRSKLPLNRTASQSAGQRPHRCETDFNKRINQTAKTGAP